MPEGIDWTALAAGASGGEGGHSIDVNDVKAALPIAFVLAMAGKQPAEYGGGELKYLCPLHDDSNPSFTVYRHEGEAERFKCWGCGAGGDVVDLIGALGHVEFKEALVKAAEMVPLAEGWAGPTIGEKAKDFDFEAARALVTQAEMYAEEEALAALVDFVEDRGLTLDPAALFERWRVGQRDAQLIIPFYRRDGGLQSYKWRTATTKAISAKGSDFDSVLYGEWLDTDVSKPVVLTEGESDTWVIDSLPGRPYAALGLPTGASAHPKPAQVEQLRGRFVILALDGDQAGRLGAMRWAAALTGVASELRVAGLPDDTDIANVEDPAFFLAAARTPGRPPKGLQPDPTRPAYVRPPRKEGDVPEELSNWCLAPDRVLLGPGGDSWEGRLAKTDKRVVLRTRDLDTSRSFKDWGNPVGANWYGSERDLQLLKGHLQAEAAFLPSGRSVDVAGLHEGRYVWPGGSVGGGYWSYVPGRIVVPLEEGMHLAEGPWVPNLVHVLRGLHDRRVTDPIIAWMAAAPVRSLLHEFPVLAVTGASRSGKTTLLETMLSAFSGTTISLNLTSTTPHAMFGYVGSTNAFPVWFDEYRPGARQDTMERFRQVLRDAWTAQSSAKGGMTDNWREVVAVPALAPIVVTGEDSFSETSHVDRMALVSMPHLGKNPEALLAIRDLGPTGFPLFYLRWVQEWHQRPEGRAAIRNFEVPTPGLNSRQAITLGVLTLGWAMLRTFLAPAGVELGEPDFSLVIEEAAVAGETDPIREGLKWALEDSEAIGWRWEDPQAGIVGIRTQPFVTAIRRHTDIVLPGGEPAVRKYLRDQLAAEQKVVRIFGQQARVWAFERSRLGE